MARGTRRLGHQFAMGLERLNAADPGTLLEQYRWARAHVESAVMNEKATLHSVLELASDQARVGGYVRNMQQAIDRIGKAHLAALETHMEPLPQA